MPKSTVVPATTQELAVAGGRWERQGLLGRLVRPTTGQAPVSQLSRDRDYARAA